MMLISFEMELLAGHVSHLQVFFSWLGFLTRRHFWDIIYIYIRQVGLGGKNALASCGLEYIIGNFNSVYKLMPRQYQALPLLFI